MAERINRYRVQFWLLTALIVAGMLALTGALGYAVFGGEGLFWSAALATVAFALLPQVPHKVALRMSGARPIHPHQAPALHELNDKLALRASLPAAPKLYYVPGSGQLNAFAMGGPKDSAIVLHEGLLRVMNARQLSGILAHELSHVLNNDSWLLNLTMTMGRVSGWMAFFGRVLLLLNLPLLLMGYSYVPFMAVAILLFAPTLMGLLQMALSRTRERAADLDAARLTGDPEGLASALRTLDQYANRPTLVERLLGYRRRPQENPAADLLRSHPHTQERIERLLELAEPKRPPLYRHIPVG